MRVTPSAPRAVVAALLLVALAPCPAVARDRGVSVRVVSYNIHAGVGGDEVFDLDRQAAALRPLEADVIGLQEVDVRWGARSRWLDLAAELGSRLDMHVSFHPVYSFGTRQFGLAVLSRTPVLSAANHQIRRLPPQGTQPAPTPGFAEVVLRVRGAVMRVYVTHLDYRSNPSTRAAQVADMRRIMLRGPGPRILLGDLNASPEAPELAPLWEELTDADPGGRSFPATRPTRRIDYVAVSSGVWVRGAAVADAPLASDHRPVVADLWLRR
ncbi:endonuclease/exonuclease/phosphatase family protein [Streptomyces sp. NPDC006879]|uniref:endonuclease/exonuclease/phosphatase family protein n=1 Tax=Streptomyces sp. NPDC006879 TaxID=3364767 RepID=UPI003694DD12